MVQALAKQPVPELRMAYARVLLGLQRYLDASRQLEAATKEKPDLMEAWLVLATLQLQDNCLPGAESALYRFMELASAAPNAEIRQRAQTQGYLLHAQIAEKKQDYAAAEDRGQRIDNVEEVFMRRPAAPAARTPGQGGAGARAAAQPAWHLRRRQAHEAAGRGAVASGAAPLPGGVRSAGRTRGPAPDDTELIYDQAMLAEKAGRPEVMEQLLRQVIVCSPTTTMPTTRSATCSRSAACSPEAKQLILKALEFAPADPFITDSPGWGGIPHGQAR